MSKIFKEDAYSLGLLYVYLFSSKTQMILSKDALDNFYKLMEKNLEELNSNDIFLYNSRYEKEPIYFYNIDEQGKEYYILKYNFNLEEAEKDYIDNIPINHLIASQMTNTLNSLGLIKINNHIQLKRYILNEKHDGECCNNCNYNISYNLQTEIIRENSKYMKMDEEKARKDIGTCEYNINEDEIRNMGYWCPNYSKSDTEKELVLKKYL